jgi:hypothetical protein
MPLFPVPILVVLQVSVTHWFSGPTYTLFLGYLLDLHNPDGLEWHFNMTEEYGHVARLKGGLIAVRHCIVKNLAVLTNLGYLGRCIVHYRPGSLELYSY